MIPFKEKWYYVPDMQGSYSIKKVLPNLKLYNVKTGYKAFDWTVPDEWIFNDAYIEDPSGKKIVDAKKNFLH